MTRGGGVGGDDGLRSEGRAYIAGVCESVLESIPVQRALSTSAAASPGSPCFVSMPRYQLR